MLLRCRVIGVGPRRIVSLSLRKCSAQRNDFDKYCMDFVKTRDHSGYLSGLLMPREHRGVYYALQAYNIEIATIRDHIPRNSVQAGRIRFQYWKDALQQMYSSEGLDVSNTQPIANALNFYIHRHNLTSRWFERALEARYSVVHSLEVGRRPLKTC
jgi:phytoene/squalene synthetase